MHPYVPHLLEDIAKAHRLKFKGEFERPQTMEEHFEDIERWIHEDPPNTFSDYCGLKSEEFPPSDQLTDEDMSIVIQAFEKLLYSWNLGIDLPEALPTPIAYTMTVDTLNQKTALVNDGFMIFDYCSGSPEGCKFKEFCPCLNTVIDLPEDLSFDCDDEDLPF